MNRIEISFAFILLSISLTNCNKSSNQEGKSNTLDSDTPTIEMVSDAVDSDGSTEEVNAEDSVELTQLVRQVYKWRLANKLDDFPYEVDSKSPEIFKGIDWEIYDRNVRTLESTNFF